MALSDNLISYWSLDEASGDAIDAHSTNDLTETSGTIAATTGVVNGGRDFEAADSEYFTIASNAELTTGDIDFTVAGWLLIETDITASDDAITKFTGADLNSEWLIGISGSRFRFLKRSASTNIVATANNFGAPSAATFYFVVAWHDSVNNVMGISINDGTPDTTSSSTGLNSGSAPFVIGARGTPAEYWDGIIDEVGFWKRVLTSSEITELYNAGAGRDYAYITGGAATFVPFPRPRGMYGGMSVMRGGR